MIYVDSSVVLARLLAESRTPRDAFWDGALVASRLVEYEVWNRVHARRLSPSHGDAARGLLGRIAFVELAQPVLIRALEGWPAPIRTLDALHLATALFVKERDRGLRFATYDHRLAVAARRMKLAVYRP